MLNFDGVPLSLANARPSPNKEPGVNKYVVEKLYRVHRERVRDCHSLVDCHVEVPDFMQNNSWKAASEAHKQEMIRKKNEEIYRRIAKAENTESQMTKENREHIKHIEGELVLMQRLKVMGRVHREHKIQRENEDLMKRIERARPEYTQKAIKEWYKHHVHFKEGRRSEPTAGHLGFRNMKGLFPLPLPPLTGGSSNIELALHYAAAKNRGAGGDSPGSQSSPMLSPVVTSGERNQRRGQLRSFLNEESEGSDGERSVLSGFFSSPPPNLMMTKSLGGDGSGGGAHGPYSPPLPSSTPMSPLTPIEGMSGSGKKKGGRRNKKNDATTGADEENVKGKKKTKTKSGGDVGKSNNNTNNTGNSKVRRSGSSFVSSSMPSTPMIKSAGSGGDGEDGSLASSSKEQDEFLEQFYVDAEFFVLIVKLIHVPFENRMSIVQILARKSYDENLYIRLLSALPPYSMESVRPIPIDDAFEVIASGSGSILNVMSANADLPSLRGALIKLFKEVDSDENGYLTHDEFTMLMEKAQLGFSKGELRYVIEEADHNGNGVVDYSEFVPLAVDMIQAFRARSLAKAYYEKRESMIETQVVRQMRNTDWDNFNEVVLLKVADYDPKKTGTVRPTDARKALMAVSGALRLTEFEISYVMEHIPKDVLNRVLYASMGESLKQARFQQLKRHLIEEQGSELQKHLFMLARAEEFSANAGLDHNAHPGRLTLKSFSNMLSSSKMFSLSRIQITVVQSDALSEALNNGGFFSYEPIIPILAKMIEIMLSPETLRQRAELIDPYNLSLTSESLAAEMNNESFEQRLRGLFNASDREEKGYLTEAQFDLCLRALDLHLTVDEVNALFYLADADHVGMVNFEHFKLFFAKNIAHMEREKHLRILRSTLHDHHHQGSKEERSSMIEQLTQHLAFVFQAADTDHTGYLSYHEFEDVLTNLEVQVSPFQIDTLLSEMDSDHAGMIKYSNFVPVCADLLQAFLSKELAQEDSATIEQDAKARAHTITLQSANDIHNIAIYIREAVMSVEMHGEDMTHHERMHALQTCLRTPHSNLTRNEVNFLIARLFTVSRSEQGVSSSQFGDSIYRNDRGEADLHPLPAHDSSEIRDLIRVKAASLRVARGRHGYNAHEKEKAHEKVASVAVGSRERRPTVHSKHTSNSHEVHRRTHYLPTRTAQEITDAVFECRKQSIMRGILNNISDSAAATLLLKSLEHAKYTLVLEGKMQSSSIYLPVKTCFEILQESAPLRLTRGQIMVIIAWTDCYDSNNTAIDYKRFAAYAASMVKKLQDADYQEKRSRILHMMAKGGQGSERGGGDEADGDQGGGKIGFAKHNDFALNGLTEADLHNYFEREFSAVQNRSTFTVSKEEFIQILRQTPLLKLSETDCITLYSAFPNDADGCVHWKEFVPWSYESISQLCMERLVQRRITLLSLEGHNDRRHARPKNQYLSNSKSASRIGTPLEEEGGTRSGPFLSTTSEEEEMPSIASSVSMAHQSMDALGNLASKLVELLKVHSYSLNDIEPPPGANTILGNGDKLGSVCVCFLPVDEIAYEVTHELQGEHVQEDDELSLESLSNEHSEGSNSALLEILVDVPCTVVPAPQKSPQLLRGQVGGGSMKASPSSMKVDSEKNNPPRKKSTAAITVSLLPCTLRMLVVDKPMSLDRELHVSVEYVNVTNAKGEQTSFVASLAQPVQLPSMCLVDSHAAVNYAKTLVDRVSLEITANNAQPPVLSLRASESAFFGHAMENW